MAGGREYTGHQRKIINRYYEHKDTIMLTKLAETVSELYLCTSEKKAEALWKSAATAIKNIGADPARAAKVLAARDVQGLARLVQDAQSPPPR